MDLELELEKDILDEKKVKEFIIIPEADFKYGGKLKQKYPNLIFDLLIILFGLVSRQNIQNLGIINNYDSEIHLIIQGNGNQNFLNDNFQFEPSEVFVNGYKNDSCKKICYFSNDLNNK